MTVSVCVRRTAPPIDSPVTAPSVRCTPTSSVPPGWPMPISVMPSAKSAVSTTAVATLPEARGQGLGAHVTAEPLRRAQALGYRVGVLQSSDAGHPVYRRLGFQDVGAVPLFVRMPGG